MIDLDSIWTDAFNNEVQRASERGVEKSLWRKGGRATKDNPDKENGEWWTTSGHQMFLSWVQWRNNNDWTVWTTPDGEPAIELNLMVQFADQYVKMGIDRVMLLPTGELIILDLKSGQRTPTNDLQLAFYAAGLEKTYGTRATYGVYWMARTGTTSIPVALDKYPSTMIERIVADFAAQRDLGIYIPNLSHCNLCGVKEYCSWMNGDKAVIPIGTKGN
jgi:putative RecB family exonuclease